MSLLNIPDKDISQRLKKETIKSICRVCLDDKKNLHSIFHLNCWIYQAQFFQFNLRQFLKDYVNLIFQEGDEFPHTICEACLSQITAAYVLKQQCVKADRILNDFLKHDVSVNSNTESDITKMCKIEDETKISEKAKSDLCIVSTVLENECLHVNDDNNLSSDDLRHNEEAESNGNEDEQNVVVNGNDTIYDGVEPTLKKVIFKCNSCKEIVSSFNELTEHRKIHGKEIFQCTVCEASFRHMNNLEKHKRVHICVKKILGPYQCGSFMEKFTDEDSLGVHTCFQKETTSFKCSYCDRNFSQRRPLENHLKTHTGERPHVCDICGKGYIQRNNLTIHRRTHTGEKPFICKECGKAFTSGASLTLHMPVHTGVKDFVCTICGKRMARSGELTIHMRTHTGEKPYACRTCSKTFIKKSSLQAHMYSHSGEKNYICPICGRRIAHAGKLTVHMKTHSNTKPFTCPVCQRCFANQSYLKQHSKIHVDTAGSGGRIFLCHCGQRFSKRSSLTDHMNTHTDVRPYECNICHHAFGQISTRNYHIKSAHPETCIISSKET